MIVDYVTGLGVKWRAERRPGPCLHGAYGLGGSHESNNHTAAHEPASPLPRHIPEKIEDLSACKDLDTDVHSSTVHNSQKRETARVSIS